MATKRRVTVSATINGVDDETFGSNEFGHAEFTRDTILGNAQPQKGGSMRWFIKAITVVFLAGCATPGDKTGNDVNTFGAFLGAVLAGAAAAPGRNVEGGDLAPPPRRRGPPPNAEGREQLIDKIKNDCVGKGWVYTDLGGGGSTCGPTQVSSQPPMSADAAAATALTLPPTPILNILSFRDWEGTWNLQWEYDGQWYGKPLKLRSGQAGIDGDYVLGALEGTFVHGDFSKVTGAFTNTSATGVDCPSGKQGGLFSFTLANDGRSMDGWWDVCGTGKKRIWKADKRGGISQQ